MKKSKRYTRYAFGIGLLLFLGLATTTTGLFLLKSSLSAHHERILERTHDLIPAERLRTALLGYIASDRGYLLTGDAAFLERVRFAEGELKHQFAELQKRVRSPEDERLLGAIRTTESAHQRAVDKALGLRAKEGLSEIVKQLFASEVLPNRLAMQNAVDAMVSHKERELLQVEELSRRASNRAVTTIFFLSIASLGLMALLAALLARNLARLYRNAADSSEKILRLNDELSRSNVELNHFAAIASHDLRSPLNVICNYGSRLEKKVAASEDRSLKESVAFMAEAARKLRELVDDLLDYARATNGETKLERVRLDDIVDQAKENLRQEIQSSGARIVCDGLPEIRGNPIQLRQLFQNLIGNAIHYRRDEPPVVKIWAKEESAGWVIVTSDNGIGIDDKHAQEIFEPFKRLHSYQERPGTGLGLPICRSVVERHGGTIWVESVVGKGTDFFFRLPKTPDLIERAS